MVGTSWGVGLAELALFGTSKELSIERGGWENRAGPSLAAEERNHLCDDSTVIYIPIMILLMRME